MAIAPRCHKSGFSATLGSFSPALTGWTNSGAGVSGTAPAAGDLVVLFSPENGASNTFSQTAGTTWADLSNGPINNGGAVGLTTMILGRIWTGAETAPTFAWGTANLGVWVLVAIAPDAGSTIAVDVLSAVGKDTTAGTSHTAPSATATGTDLSVLFYGLEASANGTTAVTETAPTNWTGLITASQAGTASTKSISGAVNYRQSQTGTVTPGAATTNVSTEANMYQLLVTQTAAAAIPEVVMAPPVVY